MTDNRWISYFYHGQTEMFVSVVRKINDGWIFDYSGDRHYAIALTDEQFRAFAKWRKDCYSDVGFCFAA